ncbi:hypothetical protein [Nostoc sp.]
MNRKLLTKLILVLSKTSLLTITSLVISLEPSLAQPTAVNRSPRTASTLPPANNPISQTPPDNPTPGPTPPDNPTPGPTPPDNPTPSPTPSDNPTPPDNSTPGPTPPDNPTPGPTPPDNPTPGSTPAPTSTPSPTPTSTPSPTPTFTPSPTPTSTPSPTPTFTPSPTPTSTPSPTPTSTPSPTPTFTPSPTPTSTPSPTPTFTPSPTPTFTPSPAPTFTPSPTPTFTPSPAPTFTPSPAPTFTPSPTPRTPIQNQPSLQKPASELLPLGATRSYIGIGANIGLSGGNTALAQGAFTIFSKIGLTKNFSFRPAALVSDNSVFLLPVTFDFPVNSVTDLGEDQINVISYVGAGAAISTGEHSTVGFLLNGGVDVPLSPEFTATAGVNVSFLEQTDVGLLLGIGYNF